MAFGVVMVLLPEEVGDLSGGASWNPSLLRLPLPRELLGLGYLGWGHPLGNDIAVLDRIIVALAGRKTGGSKVIPRIGPYALSAASANTRYLRGPPGTTASKG